MLSDSPFDVSAVFESSHNFKSCFARSVVVNSQYQYLRALQGQQPLQRDANGAEKSGVNKGAPTNESAPHCSTSYASRRESFLMESRRNSGIGDSKRSSACSSRIAEMPVENLLLKSQIETLEWQLKQTEASREMYRALMKQVVKYLERVHHNLQILESKLNQSQQAVHRTQSDYQMTCKDNTVDGSVSPCVSASMDYTAFRDFTWRRHKRPQSSSEEIPLERLSQEAFRLFRTAQSLLNTRAPDLAHVNNDTSEDLQFLEQLAKEFPRQQESGTQNSLSNCTRLQLPLPEEEVPAAAAFSRKLSLHKSAGELKRNSFHGTPTKSPRTMDTFSVISEDCPRLSSTTVDDFHSDSGRAERDKGRVFKFDLEKSNSPPISTVSSAEDESGFSSMNSFQEIGIPLLHSIASEERVAKESLFKNALQDSVEVCSKQKRGEKVGPENKTTRVKELKLWEQSEAAASHKRWSSAPAESSAATEKQALKVLWV